MPKLRIYQQILICFALIVAALVGVSLIIHSINQYALKKELGRFTEHTAEALYRDFSTEMTWQRQQSQVMARLIEGEAKTGRTLNAVGEQILGLDPEMDAVGLYDRGGRMAQGNYRNFEAVSPELRLPEELPKLAHTEKAGVPIFEVIYFNTGNPKDSPYFLRTLIPLTSAPGNAAFYLQQKNFKYLQNLVRTNNSLYDAFYIIDSKGFIIAGPAGAEHREQISGEDYREFLQIQPGVTHEYESTSQAAQDVQPESAKRGKDADEEPPLQKVIVKMPDINWGIIIESPYHMKQKYIQRANTHTLLVILGCLLLMLLLVVPYILSISRNFRQLIKGVKALGEGNYYRRIRLITNFFTPYEIVYLTLEFNRMARKTAESWQTIQEANRKLAKLDEFKSNLIDTVSHELRTPLTSIKGYTSRLIRYNNTLDDEARIKSLKVVKQQADRLSRLVEDLLVIPDLETASLRVYPDQVDLAPLMDNAIHTIQAKEQRDFIVSLAPELDAELSVLADPDRLEQILVNLLDNAVKYSLPDTPIQVLVAPDDEAPEENLPGRIAISVVNICDPIPMEKLDELDSLFEKFKRLDDSLIRTTRGSGLGLFITRGLVEAMGGDIRLSHVEGTFQVRFTIPLYAPAADTSEEPAIA
ncbi:MAG TPA: HAMP domain-containing sensor histidine kinase [Coleofasciculaceae cyanobacterium]